jgi:hypothetical protein
MGFIADIGGLGKDLFGGSESKSGFTETQQNRISQADVRGSEQLVLDPAAIQKIIQDVLGGTEGLASILSGEQNAGIFNSSVAQGQATDLIQGLVGELAKITGKTVSDQSQVEREVQSGTQANTEKQESSGLLKDIAGLDPTGIASFQTKNLPGDTSDPKTSTTLPDIGLPSITPPAVADAQETLTGVDKAIDDATTPQGVTDIQTSIDTVEKEGEQVIADAVAQLLGL